MFLTRIAYGMARDGALMKALARVAPSGTPRLAPSATILGGVLFASSGVYEHLIATSVPLAITINAAMDATAIRLRIREPQLTRPFRMPWFPLPALLGLAINLALLAALVMDDPAHSLLGLLLLAAIGAVYAGRARLL